MSHIVTIRTEVRDAVAVDAACRRLMWQAPLMGTHRVFSKQVEGLAVFPPQWRFPIVCDLQNGALQYDNYSGNWGDASELNRFKQAYAVEKSRIELRRQGKAVIERELADGTVQLTVQLEVA